MSLTPQKLLDKALSMAGEAEFSLNGVYNTPGSTPWDIQSIQARSEQYTLLSETYVLMAEAQLKIDQEATLQLERKKHEAEMELLRRQGFLAADRPEAPADWKQRYSKEELSTDLRIECRSCDQILDATMVCDKCGKFSG